MTFRIMCVRRPGVRVRTLGVRGAIVLPFVAMQAVTASAYASTPHPPKPKPSFALRIAIDNGRSSLRQGDQVTYTTKVSNTGTVDTPVLGFSQTLVPGLTFLSATPKGTLSADSIGWHRSLAAGKTNQFTVTVQVGRLSPALQRLAVVACASNKADGRPIVCAAHSDRLSALAVNRQSRPTGSAGRHWLPIAGVAALLLASVAFLARRRMRHAE